MNSLKNFAEDKRASTFILNFNGCNQKCLFCMKSEDISNNNKPTYENIAKKIIYAKKAGYSKIDFYGGEPTCFGFLKDAIKLTNTLGMKVSLATNALNFSSRAYTDNFFPGIRIFSIRTSLHSHKAGDHDTITQIKGSFQKTTKGIKNILMYDKLLIVNIIITSINYKDIVDMLYYIYRLGVRGIKFSGLVFEGRARINKWLNIDLPIYLPYLLKAIEVSKKLGFYLIELEKLPKFRDSTPIYCNPVFFREFKRREKI